MATNTYVALATQTLGTAAATVIFSGISQAYTDLVLVMTNIPSGSSGQDIKVNFNGDTGANYSRTYLLGSGTAASSGRSSGASYWAPSGSYSNENIIFNFMNYSNTTTYKTFIGKTAAPGDYYAATVGLWRSTSAITSIVFGLAGGSFDAGSTFSIYGIAATSVGAKATGGTIYSDSSYYYHVFAGNGTFTPTQSISADLLVVAGGGGTNGQCAGGGGAGGLLVQSGRSLTATNYTVTVGAGGALGNASQASSGSNSVFDTSTALGGGCGGYANITVNGTNGGSGGGAAYNGTVGGTSTQGNSGGATGYGFAGGVGNNAGTQSAGGGGGAGAVGAAGTNAQGGNGGIGRTDSLINAIGVATGMGQLVSGNYYFAGGGGGGVISGSIGIGGNGGGGNGGIYNTGSPNGTAGVANTGGGAGGAGLAGAGFSGGSGVVIVRYAR